MENKRQTFLNNQSMNFRRILLSNRKGQSAVEYILLLSVVSSLAFGVYKSNWFKSMFGENSSFFDTIRKRMEYEYRYTQSGKEDTLGMSYMGTHDSYHAVGGSESHYFMPLEKYPNK